MTNHNDEWAEALRTGFAESWFNNYPDDADLADHVNEMLKNSNLLTAEQVCQDRKRFYNRPQRGEGIREEEASPTKNVILNKANQLSIKEALAEIIDNIFDNFERNTSNSLKIEIAVYPRNSVAPGEILVTENSGGIEKERIIPLIQLGFSERSARGIGAWGEGFKMAAFALGEEVEVFSHYPRESPVAIHFPRGWLNPKNEFLWKKWKVNTYKIAKNPPQEGTTLIRINYLHLKVLELLGLNDVSSETPASVCEELANYFGEIYTEKYRELVRLKRAEISIKISIGAFSQKIEFKERVRTRFIKHLAFIPWLRPLHWKLSWETPIDGVRMARLNAEIYAGLSATFDSFQNYEPNDTGVEMWGNGRLFSLKGRIDDESVGWGYKFGGRAGTNPNATSSTRRLTIVILFTAEDSRDIPWAAPVKNDYNRRSEFYAEIQKASASVIKLYKDGARLLESRIRPFSWQWPNYSETEKLNFIFKDSDATDVFKQEFANSRFGRKIIDYQPDFSFVEREGSDVALKTRSLFNIAPNAIKSVEIAARETKESSEEVVEFLKALFPSLYKQAQLEESLGLSIEEEFE